MTAIFILLHTSCANSTSVVHTSLFTSYKNIERSMLFLKKKGSRSSKLQKPYFRLDHHHRWSTGHIAVTSPCHRSWLSSHKTLFILDQVTCMSSIGHKRCSRLDWASFKALTFFSIAIRWSTYRLAILQWLPPRLSQKLASFTRIMLSSSAGLHVKYIHDMKESITMHVHVEFTCWLTCTSQGYLQLGILLLQLQTQCCL